jgi:cyclopropane-fatty-acyl-phospholipid synthase
MWEFYLAYCEAGFRSDYLGVSQLQLARRPSWA